MLRAFRNVGYLSHEQLRQKLGIADRRIQNFIRDGHVERVDVFDKHTKSISHVYRLTERGMEFTNQQMNLTNFYRSVSVSHDLALAHRYLQCSPEQQRAWLTERDWLDRFKQEIDRLESQREYDRADELKKLWEDKLLSVPDGGYAVEGEQAVAVEIITDNYGKAEIQAKAEFAQVMQVEYQSYKI